ncbi:MAG: DNA adenine methyltransferase YhdJ [Promethearchaeota archaeon]|nr:MAG: DNA adenine methyltransferase YhdJ [Candidatus Lokiarchaeota archaeon]
MVKLIWDNKDDAIKHSAISETKDDKTKFHKFETIYPEQKLIINRESKAKWYNKLFWGDNLPFLKYLIPDFKEKIDLIYIDPPFFSGSNYYIKVQEKNSDTSYEKVAYHDHWGNDLDKYLQMLYKRIFLFKKLLSKKGLLFIHLDWHVSHYIKIILDEIFGADKFINNIVWYYYNKYSAGKRALPRAHDDILLYSKTNEHVLNDIRIPREKPRKQLKRVMVDGVLKNAKDEDGKVIYRMVKDKKLDDVWKIPCLQPASKQWTGYPTQKHHKLLNRIIKLGSDEGDLVADFFCGSGTMFLEAIKLNRRFIGSDISKYSIHLTMNRIKKIYQKDKQAKFIKYPIHVYTHLTQEKKKLISEGFFDKELEIKRKK